MRERNYLKILIFLIISVVIVIVAMACYNYEIANKRNNDGIGDNSTQLGENIILYNGVEILNKTGIQYIEDMDINNQSNNKYNTTFYNYENGKYEGVTIG